MRRCPALPTTFHLTLSLLCILTAPALADWNVADAGAVGDGKTDCTAVFQQLLDEAAAAGGGIVHVPAGQYRINGNLSIPGGVTLQGTWRVPPTNRHDGAPTFRGSTLLAYAGRGEPDAEPFIRLAGNGATVAGFVVHYPEWSQDDVPPVPYPPCILGENTDNMGVLDMCLINPYEGIVLIRAGRHFVRNVYGYPIKRGLYVDQIYDVGRVENCHFWPFGVHYKADDPYCEWINTKGVAFEFARTDWQYVLNTFTFGYGVGYKFSESEHGSCNGNFLGIGADSCERSVLVEQCITPGLLITNGEFVGRWGGNESVGVEIGEKVRDKVSLNNCGFWGALDRCVWMRAPEGQFTAIGTNFARWDMGGRGSPAIQIDAGKAIVQGNTFTQEGTHLVVGENVVSAIITGNQAAMGLNAENKAETRAIFWANEMDRRTWTPDAKRAYRIDVGTEGDGRYLSGWNQQEPAFHWDGEGTMRWTSGDSRLILPVLPGEEYTVSIEAYAHENALQPGAGVYLNGEALAEIESATRQTITVRIPPQEIDSVTLHLRSKAWVPAKVLGTRDARNLSFSVREVRVTAKDDPERWYNANTGEWIGE